MIALVQAAVAAIAPARVGAVDYNDPMLLLHGEGWSVSLACPWRLTRAGVLICAFGDEHAAVEVQKLVGETLDTVAVRAPGIADDPAFALSGGYCLEAFADTDLDPWVVRTPDATIVGSASRPLDE
jgi:hypothetical protein